jgi:hypothetical protein
MPHTARRRFCVVLLVVSLALLPAAPAVAAPAHGATASLLAWLDGWLGWPGLATTRSVLDGSEAYPTMDPDGAEANLPTDDANATTASSPTDTGGETHPTMDPDG